MGNLVYGQTRHPVTAALASAALLPFAAIVLAGSAPSIAGAAAFAVLLGFGSGLKSIVQGTLPLALFGTLGYGAKIGRMAAARLVLSALAPFPMAWLMETIGARAALMLMAGVGLLGLAALVRVAAICRAQGID